MFIKYEAEVSSRVGGGEKGVVDFGKFFTETNEQKFRLHWPLWLFICDFSSLHLHKDFTTPRGRPCLFHRLRVTTEACFNSSNLSFHQCLRNQIWFSGRTSQVIQQRINYSRIHGVHSTLHLAITANRTPLYIIRNTKF